MFTSAPLRGMRDFLPAEKARRERVLASITRAYNAHGFAEIETPYVEQLDRLMSNQGGDNEKMLFKIQKRGITPDQLGSATTPDDLCDSGLRYDLTLPLARYYANNIGRIPQVFRVLQTGPVWRAERPQKGRYRQFTQCDIDIIGEPSLLADAELITVTLKALSSLGLRGLKLRLNDRRLLVAVLRDVEVPPDVWSSCLVAIDKLDKVGIAGVSAEVAGLLTPEVHKKLLSRLQRFSLLDFSLQDFVEIIRRPEVPELVAGLEQVLNAVATGLGEAMGVNLQFDATLVRGMGYYSGPIFEVWHPESTGAISGGGRYDGVIGKFMKHDVPATGFSIGFERLMNLLPELSEADNAKVCLIYEPTADWGTVLEAQGRLVEQNLCVRLAPRQKKLASLLESLKADGFVQWASLDTDGLLSNFRLIE